MKKTYLLRGHHGCCLTFFGGKGYSNSFVDNMTKIKNELDNNPLVCITNQTDCICNACPNKENEKCLSEDKVCKYDKKVMQLCNITNGAILPYFEFRQLIQKNILLVGKREDICGDCEWTSLCSIKDTNF